MTPFLTAVWSDLIMASYAVPDGMLLPYLPAGLEIDRWQGQAWCSLVAFDFTQTRVFGWSLPPMFGVCDFPEVNLRFYVRQGRHRGVLFIREFVPGHIAAMVARWLYNEPYAVARMSSRTTQVDSLRRVRHDVFFARRRQRIAVTACGLAQAPDDNGFSDWLKEQSWGFGQNRRGRAIRYRVAHPPWRTYPLEDCDLSLDFAALYGAPWRRLQHRSPDHLLFAEGSHVAVYPGQLI